MTTDININSTELKQTLKELELALKLSAKQKQLKENAKLQAQEDFWQDQARAIKLSQASEMILAEIKPVLELGEELADILAWQTLINQEFDEKLAGELKERVASWQEQAEKLKLQTLFSQEHDRAAAFLAIHAGTGGVDAQDWAQILERLYLRYAEKKGWQAEILDRVVGTEAGIKSVLMQIKGVNVYGHLKSEQGVHRLLRNSPFNADGLRQTSFALVEVTPELADSAQQDINLEEVKFDVFRASGPGGQGVNTTDSAVRLTHLPTGLVVTCQSERSQHQNKERALKVLRAKLNQLALESQAAKERELKGELVKAEWGRQIRSYFLYGNRLIKDHRSAYESRDIEGVLAGDLDEFVSAYLKYLAKQNQP